MKVEKRALLHVFCYVVYSSSFCGIVEKQRFALIVGIPAAGLAQQLYHHHVRWTCMKGYHHLLAVYGECYHRRFFFVAASTSRFHLKSHVRISGRV